MPLHPEKLASLLPHWLPRRFDWRARKLIARIRSNHADLAAIEALAGHYAKRADHGSLANLMEGFGSSLQDTHAAADAYVRAADAALMLDDRPRAEALYERALALEPGHAEALDRALRVAETAHDAQGMRRVLESVIETRKRRGVPGAQLANLHYRLGQLYETQLDDPAHATRLYRLAIDENPLLSGAIGSARRLLARAGDHAAVCTLFELEMDASRAPDDKRALLLSLAQYQREHCHDVNAEIVSLRRACKLVPGDLLAMRRLIEALTERAARAESVLARRTDHKRAAEVCFQVARAVPRGEAQPWLLRALEFAPDHARARGLLNELRRHGTGAVGVEDDESQHESQRVVDQRATVALPGPGAQPLLRDARAYAAARDVTMALATSELMPLRSLADERPDASGTVALSTGELLPLRSTPPPAPPAAFTRHMSQPAPATEPPPPSAADEPAPTQVPPLAAALVTPEPVPLAQPEPEPEPAPTRSRVVTELEVDPTRRVLDVELGVLSESNLFVPVNNRIADGGVFVATYQVLAAETPVALRIALPGGFCAHAHGRVSLRRESLDPFEDPAPGMCVQFEALSEEALALLERFARNRPALLIDAD